jgi:hypothetical protein
MKPVCKNPIQFCLITQRGLTHGFAIAAEIICFRWYCHAASYGIWSDFRRLWEDYMDGKRPVPWLLEGEDETVHTD